MGLFGAVLFVIVEQHAFGIAIEIVELAVAQCPKEGSEAEQA